MRRQRGVAAVTAILIVAVAASAAAVMLSQQSAMLDQATMVVSRAQADLYAQAGVDWARGVLAESFARGKGVDSLDQGWAQPIVALPIDRATVAGAIADEQGKINLNNLVNDAGQPSAPDIRILRTLLGSGLGLPTELADPVLDWIDRDSDLASGAGAEDSYYLALARPYRAPNGPMIQVEELYRIRGFDAATVAKVKPYVTALPGRTTINVNTASALVIGAALNLSPENAEALVAERARKPFATRSAFADRVREMGATSVEGLDVKSAFYSVRVQVAQDEVQLATQALVQRRDNGTTDMIWRRPLY